MNQTGLTIALLTAVAGVVGVMVWRSADAEVVAQSELRESAQPKSGKKSVAEGIKAEVSGALTVVETKGTPPSRATDKTAQIPALPERDQARLAQARKLVLRRYGPLFEQLGLSGDQREKLTQWLIDDREASVDLAAANAATGHDLSGEQGKFAQAVFDLRQQIQTQIKALLGEAGYEKFLAGDESIRQSAVVERMQKELKSSGGRLDEQQSAQLLGVMQALKVSFVSDTVVAQSTAFLTPEQQATLRNLQQRRLLGVQKENVQAAIDENLVTPGARVLETPPVK